MSMLYAGLAFFVMSLVALALGFLGVIRGAAGISNVMLLASLLMFAAGGVASYWRRHHLRHHH